MILNETQVPILKLEKKLTGKKKIDILKGKFTKETFKARFHFFVCFPKYRVENET